MATFQDEGDKDYIKADLTIDGTLIEDVGMRLKGNSTLRSLQDGGDAAGGEGMPGGGGGMVQLSADSPQELPWLISFDEYEEGRAYQGHIEIALRPAASGSDTALNEALALSLTAESGQTTQDYSFTSVSVNGGDSAARLVLDAPTPNGLTPTETVCSTKAVRTVRSTTSARIPRTTRTHSSRSTPKDPTTCSR